MKTAIAILLSLAAFANAFTSGPSVGLGVGKAVPRLSEQQPRNLAVPAQQQSPRDKESVVLSNMLREYANYNDVWRDDWSFPMTSYNRGGCE